MSSCGPLILRDRSKLVHRVTIEKRVIINYRDLQNILNFILFEGNALWSCLNTGEICQVKSA